MISSYKKCCINQKRNDTKTNEKASTFLTRVSVTEFVVKNVAKYAEKENTKTLDDNVQISDNEDKDPSYAPPPPKKLRTSIETVFRNAQNSPEVTAMLDRTKTTNNTMTMLMGAVAKAAKMDVSAALISSSTLRTNRKA